MPKGAWAPMTGRVVPLVDVDASYAKLKWFVLVATVIALASLGFAIAAFAMAWVALGR